MQNTTTIITDRAVFLGIDELESLDAPTAVGRPLPADSQWFTTDPNPGFCGPFDTEQPGDFIQICHPGADFAHFFNALPPGTVVN
ncbi:MULTISPECIES: hypothetical protein [unclassified Streptomyces]|uniref:hypothetical protein n=1 Tax=unclassified Streptomyces TaxID=2593676 RepID=UPI00382A6694